MFSSLSQEATDKEQLANAAVDAPDHTKQAETIEVAAERWRDRAFTSQEHLSKHFNDGVPGKAIYRVTTKNGWSFLEQFRLGKDGMAYSWTGVMFKPDDLYEITGVLVKASKERQASGGL